MDNITEKMKLHQQWLKSEGFDGHKIELDKSKLADLVKDYNDFSYVFFTSCDFEGTNINKKDILAFEENKYKPTVENALKLSNAKSTITDSSFVKAVLDYADFTEASIEEVNFSRADMNETLFNGAVIKNVSMVNTGLWLTNFGGATLENVDFSQAYLEEVIFSNAKLTNLLNLEKANIVSINIGTKTEPRIINGKEALQWLKDKQS